MKPIITIVMIILFSIACHDPVSADTPLIITTSMVFQPLHEIDTVRYILPNIPRRQPVVYVDYLNKWEILPLQSYWNDFSFVNSQDTIWIERRTREHLTLPVRFDFQIIY